jgi:hypothetical protein
MGSLRSYSGRTSTYQDVRDLILGEVITGVWTGRYADVGEVATDIGRIEDGLKDCVARLVAIGEREAVSAPFSEDERA